MANLVDVDEAGLWLEYSPFMEEMLATLKIKQSAKTAIIFVPYSQLSWIVDAADYPSLSEKLIE